MDNFFNQGSWNNNQEEDPCTSNYNNNYEVDYNAWPGLDSLSLDEWSMMRHSSYIGPHIEQVEYNYINCDPIFKTIVQAWIYLYFPSFRLADDPKWDLRLPYPYARRWHSTNRAVYNINYRGELDNMKVNEVIFTPYGHLDFTLPYLAPNLFHGVLLFLDKTEPYMPNRVARQFGRIQQIPKSVIAPLRAWRRPKITAYAGENDSAKWSWDARHIHRFSLRHLGPKATHGFETDPHYMERYTPRTHPRITSPHTGAIQCIGNIHGRLSPYRDALEDSFHAMHEVVIYSLDEMHPFLRR